MGILWEAPIPRQPTPEERERERQEADRRTAKAMQPPAPLDYESMDVEDYPPYGPPRMQRLKRQLIRLGLRQLPDDCLFIDDEDGGRVIRRDTGRRL